MAYLNYDQYMKQYTDVLNQKNQEEYNQKLLAAQQARQKLLESYETQKSNLANQYQTSLNKLLEEKASQLPKYTAQANQVSATAAQNARRLSEIMAAKGLGRSGTAVSELTGIYNRAGSAINDINTAKNLYLSQIANRAAELEQSRTTDLSDIERQIALAKQQGTEYEKSLADELAARQAANQAAAQMAWEPYNLQQQEAYRNLLAMYMNFLVNQAQQTGSWASPSGFTYGNYMVQLMKALGV